MLRMWCIVILAVLAVPCTAQDTTTDVSSRYIAAKQATGGEEADVSETLDVLDSVDYFPMEIYHQGDYYTFRWDANNFSVNVTLGVVEASIPAEVHGGLVVFTNAESAGQLPQISGWFDLFENTIVFQSTIDKEVLRLFITPDEGGALAYLARCVCFGAPQDDCTASECDTAKDCGPTNRAKCKWMADEEPIPDCGSGTTVAMIMTLLGFVGMKHSVRRRQT